ncbi:YbaB/EbfC family nucleoid-associated protein [Streptosporangium sp. NPDC004379]|uniref:YbaB/EbfC family nucleoid-associated protein n=1 Tax=Streptosporangium sp. NPDC004379 TaxID=3366189 RepID=UPI0036AA4CC6
MDDFRVDPGNIRDEDLDEELRRSQRMMAWIEEAQNELDEVVGTGEGPSGHVRASVGPDGTVLEVVFDPRALRLDSRTLAEEVLAAVGEARSDAERRIHELMREGLDGFDPVQARARFEQVMGGLSQ